MLGEITQKILKINLSTKDIRAEIIPSDILLKYIGGKGLNIYYLLRSVSSETLPFDPDVPLIFSNGLLTGGPAISSSRIQIGSISPLTGLIGSSNAGGFFGAELALCGFLSLFITGKAEMPVYIYIHDGKVEIRNAVSLWGLDTHETEEKIKKQLGVKKIRTAVIGPAGENLVLFASIIFPPHDAAGRTGLGATMGAKNLKAVVVKATTKHTQPLSTKIKTLIRNHINKMKQSPWFEEYAKYGDSTSVKWVDELGAGSVRNFNDVIFEQIDSVNGLSLMGLKTKSSSCFNCPIHCKGEIKIDSSRHNSFIGRLPEFESMDALGPRIGNGDATEDVYLSTMCNRWGVDTIEIGSCIGFAVDAYKRGIITDKETNGLKLEWGDPETAEKLLHQIVFRDTWLGDVFARGIKEASQIIDRGAGKYAYHVKGLSIGAMDPRGFKATALGYAVGSRGADFTNVYARLEYAISPEKAKVMFDTEKAADRLSEDGKALMVRYSIIAATVLDALGLCKIPYLTMLNDYNLSISVELVQMLLGWKITTEELSLCGERIVNAERIFNLKRGMKSDDDTLPDKFIKEPIEKGICKGSKVNLALMLKEYYELMGWDKDGYPLKSKIKELGLEEII